MLIQTIARAESIWRLQMCMRELQKAAVGACWRVQLLNDWRGRDMTLRMSRDIAMQAMLC